MTEQIVSSLAVIHRFMSAHTNFQENLQGSSINVQDTMRLESVTEAEHPTTLNVVRYLIYANMDFIVNTRLALMQYYY